MNAIARQAARLARSCKDWYQLLELCAIFGTLICDLDGLYDPATYNDRLLLGLKGTMSEAELHIIRQWMLQGAQQKTRRGELVTRVPMGYMRDDHGRVPGTPYLTAWLRFVASSRPVMRYVKEVF